MLERHLPCRGWLGLATVLDLILAATAAAGTQYTLVDLGAAPAPYVTWGATDINDSGQVVGDSFNNGSHGFLYGNGTVKDIGTLPAPYNDETNARALNASGEITGIGWNLNGPTYHAFLYAGGKMTDLGTLPGYGSASQASGINASGQICGDSELNPTSTAYTERAFLYSNGTMRSLGTLPAPYNAASTGRAINDSGEVVGFSAAGGPGPLRAGHAFLYSNGTMHDLGTLAAPYDYFSDALSINDRGQVVGYSLSATGASRAFLYANGKMQDLGTLGAPFDAGASAFRINNRGEILGSSSTSNNQSATFLFENGTMANLSDLVLQKPNAYAGAAAINDAGVIAGSAAINGEYHGIVLMPHTSPPPLPIGPNLLKNGDFALGNVGFTSGYFYNRYLGPTGPVHGLYYIGTDPSLSNSSAPSFGDHTTGSALMMLLNGSTTANTPVWQESVAVTPNTTYLFSIWTRSWGGSNLDPKPADLQLTINGSVVAADFQLSSSVDQWVQFTAEWNSQSTMAADISLTDLETSAVGNDFAIDDLSFAAIPEPGTLPYIAAVALALIRPWRRSANRPTRVSSPARV